MSEEPAAAPFDTQTEETGIAALLKQLAELGIDFKDLHSSESSLEDIFVSLVHAGKPPADAKGNT